MNSIFHLDGFPKIVTPDSFEWGPTVDLLSTIVDDPRIFRKTAGSKIVDMWGEVPPVKGHTLIHIIALGDYEKVGSNRNGDGFEEWFNRQSHPTFVKHAKLYHNHKANNPNEPDVDHSKGFVIKSAHNQDVGRVELLIAANHDKCASWLADYERGEPAAFSMGFNCFYDECSKCGFKAKKPAYYCEHVKKKASHPYGMNQILPDGSKCFVYNRSGFWNDISKVGIGADMTAFDLRKVASLSDAHGHVVSGAELGQMYIHKHGDPDPRTVTAKKIAHLESTLRAAGLPTSVGDRADRSVSMAVARKLAEAATPADVYTYLADRNVVLPVRSFFKVAMPLDLNSVEDDVNAIERKFASDGAFTWAQKSGLFPVICSNLTYERKRASTVRLPPSEEAELVSGFSVEERFSKLRDQENAVKIACFQIPGPAPDLTPRQASLACEYLAYKISAIEGMRTEMRNEGVKAAILG